MRQTDSECVAWFCEIIHDDGVTHLTRGVAKHMVGTPWYRKGLDVLPFLLNEVTRTSDSPKAYEYVAAGKPAVSTSGGTQA
jgi:hypothetical protein